jgi:hypothetical protein
MSERDAIVPEANEVMTLVERVKPLFSGVDPMVVGAALADLTALLLAGHVAENPAKTRALRDQTLKIHIRAIKALVPLNEDMLRERIEAGRNEIKNRPN